MEMNDKNDEQIRKQSIMKLLNIIRDNNKDPNIKEELDTIEERIKNRS